MNEKRGDGRFGSRGEEAKEEKSESGVIDCWSEEKDGGCSFTEKVLQVQEQRQNSSHQVKVSHARCLWR